MRWEAAHSNKGWYLDGTVDRVVRHSTKMKARKADTCRIKRYLKLKTNPGKGSKVRESRGGELIPRFVASEMSTRAPALESGACRSGISTLRNRKVALKL